jgi:hypothetical protein
VFLSSFGIYNLTIYLNADETSYEMHVGHAPEPVLEVIELSPGTYVLDRIDVYYDLKWHSVGVPASLQRQLTVESGQIFYIGDIVVEYVYRILRSPFDVNHKIDREAFEKKLMDAYEVPSSVQIVALPSHM